ncbi:MAG TPA: type I-MYXAN CRISPR-associated protein Cas6/Cmx6 [Chromatiales bacterium]|nr:type I-MYXAN CRISPR-associated protein Cas6/Cmx6 [Chromatiales bacterium]
MYWQDTSEDEHFTITDEVVDVRFRIDCPTLPVDHAWPLREAICSHLPWFMEEPIAGLHTIHGADSGNGWERPQDPDALLHLSRRTRLALRLPQEKVSDAMGLVGKALDIAGNTMRIGKADTRLLSVTTTLYSRHVLSDPEKDENQFIEWAAEQLRTLNIRFKKILAGRESTFKTPAGPLHTRSLMVGNLRYQDALQLQQAGIGAERTLGCGLFIPQKTV